MELTVTLEGGKRVTTQLRDHRITTDQPLQQGGGDTAPAPFELFVASIGTCAGFYVQAYCESKAIDSSGIEITLRTERDPHSKLVTSFITTLHLPNSIPVRLHPVLQKVAEQCAVKKTIMANPTFVIRTVTLGDSPSL